ncbi:DgyrCDS11018 [Dimorphilus gyrociliatus]|uniref:DgyrCDS11018 n=1 Tax=Dimorphilus gyrociliatus TaxID=2664684 RepID=A0A7I8W231_9ANNE|nr:DgyrCDS11018 [Dimorphilus gyrociliatus]
MSNSRNVQAYPPISNLYSSSSDTDDYRFPPGEYSANMNRKRQLVPNAYKSKKRLCNESSNGATLEELNEQDADFDDFSEIRSAYFLIKNMFPTDKFQSQIPAIVLKHQLYALVSDRTQVDRELDDMRKNGEVKLFRLGSEDIDFALVLTDDYKNHIHEILLPKALKKTALDRFMNNIILKGNFVSVDKKQLNENHITDNDITALISAGLLTVRDVGCYWLSIPSVSLYSKSLMRGRKACLTMIKKCKYKEILQPELEKRKLPKVAKLVVGQSKTGSKAMLRLNRPDNCGCIRLVLLTVFGSLACLITGLFLGCMLTKEDANTENLIRERLRLKQYLLNKRNTRGDWSYQNTPLVLMALQLSDTHWAFGNIDSQRTIDKLDIQLLSSLSRSVRGIGKELTTIRLAQYINALLVLFRNPSNFYGHNLIEMLSQHLQQTVYYSKTNAYAVSWSIIALFNGRTDIHLDHLYKIIKLQKSDGSFTGGFGETCMSVMALSCFRDKTIVGQALGRSIDYILRKRRNDNSYGSVLETALALQAINAGGRRYLLDEDYESSLLWLARRSEFGKNSFDNIEVATHVLIALQSTNLLSIRNIVGVSEKKEVANLVGPSIRPVHSKLERSFRFVALCDQTDECMELPSTDVMEFTKTAPKHTGNVDPIDVSSTPNDKKKEEKEEKAPDTNLK